MNKENTKYLFDNFDFFHPEKPLTESLMGFGFECGDGWFELIKELCEKIKTLDCPNLVVTQVKKKFGSLCFYFNRQSIDKAKLEPLKILIDEAVEKSIQTCDQCGGSGTRKKSKGLVAVRCKNCENS